MVVYEYLSAHANRSSALPYFHQISNEACLHDHAYAHIRSVAFHCLIEKIILLAINFCDFVVRYNIRPYESVM